MAGRITTRGWRHAAVAAMAAYALVLQVLLLSMAGATHAAAASAPQGIVCAQADAPSRPDQAPAHAHDSLCCLAACHGSGAAGPVPVLALLERSGPVVVAHDRVPAAPVLRPSSNVLPVGSRAPPRLG